MKTYPMKARIRNEGTGPARVDIFDDIGAGGWFSEGYTPASFADAIKGVSGPLDVHINSGGGDVADGIAIASAIRAYPGRKRTVVDGMAASIASVIAQAGDERIVEPGAMLMIHDPLTACMGNQADFLKVAETLGKHGDNLAQQYADRAGGTAAQWRDVMRQEAWYTADEAVAAGLADRVGTAEARLPQSLDVDALAAHAPARIMARLRVMPRAHAPAIADADGGDDDDDAPPCKTCRGKGRLPHPGTGKPGKVCPSCGGTGTYDPDDGDDEGDDEGQGADEGMQDRLRAQAGKPYEPQPYKRTSDENVQCPVCQKYSDDDARNCGQCGVQLVGRTDVREAPLAPAARAGIDAEAVRALVREELRAAAAKADDSPWDASKAWAAGSASDDPAAFFAGICAGEKTTGEPGTQAHWALPYRYSPDSAPNAAAVRNCLARLDQTQDLKDPEGARKKLQGLMKDINPDYEPDDSTSTSVSGLDLEKIRAALPALKGVTA
jgi:ATP-dependent protease ClpP protease subunit